MDIYDFLTTHKNNWTHEYVVTKKTNGTMRTRQREPRQPDESIYRQEKGILIYLEKLRADKVLGISKAYQMQTQHDYHNVAEYNLYVKIRNTP